MKDNNIDVKKLTKANYNLIDTLRHLNGTIFQDLDFLNYHKDFDTAFTILGFFDDNEKLLGFLPCHIRDGILLSPFKASYGGIVVKKGSFQSIYRVYLALVDWCKNNNIKKIELIIAPLIYNNILSQDINFVLHYLGFNNYENQFSSALDLSLLDIEKPLSHLSSAGARAIKKSIKEKIEVKISLDFDEYYPILKTNKAKFNVLPAHTLDELRDLKQRMPDAFQLFAVYHQDKMIGGVFTFHANDNVLLAFYIASLEEYRDLRPVNRCLHEVSLWAKDNGYAYLDLGVSMNTESDNPMEPAWNLISFKEFIGARGFLRQKYSLKLSS